MLKMIDDSFLAGYKPPRPEFRETEGLSEELKPIWSALRDRKIRLALRRGYQILRESTLTNEVRAALLAGLASAEWDNGVVEDAKRMARESLSLYPQQWLAWRVLLTAYIAEKAFAKATNLIDDHTPPSEVPAWDEVLGSTERHLIRATCAWMTSDWDCTATQLNEAYPKGVESMPSFLQEDWFRLAFYRESPEDAAEAARQLIAENSVEKADILLQTLVRQGWHRQALTLYRAIFEQDPTNELLRRRVVGLYIREGEVNEARRLMEQGALRLAV